MSNRMPELEPMEQNSLRARVFNYISEEIINGNYKTGDPLVETRLAEGLGVSRTPVREALHQLELEGLVTLVPNKGVVVAGVSEKDVEDIYAIRSEIEGLAVRWAAERIDAELLRELEETAELMEYYTKKGDLAQVSKLDAKFHALIYASCKSKVLRHTLSTIMRYVQQARLGSLRVPTRAKQALKEHKAILNAIVLQDGALAEALMIAHIKQAQENLLQQKKKLQKATD